MKIVQYAASGLFALLLGLSTVAWAEVDPDNAKIMIKDTTDQMIAALQAEETSLAEDPSKVYGLVDEIVLPNFDFERMSMLVLGKNWRKASDEQRSAFIQAFRNLLVRTYATAIAKAVIKEGGVQVSYEPVRAEQGDKWVTVKTQVKHKDNTFSVDYNVYPDPASSQWKVFNVVVEGISLVTNYRTEFNNDISTIGMDQLIEKIKSRNESEMSKAIKVEIAE